MKRARPRPVLNLKRPKENTVRYFFMNVSYGHLIYLDSFREFLDKWACTREGKK